MVEGKRTGVGAAFLLLSVIILGGCTKKEFDFTTLTRAEFLDANENAVVDDGDVVKLTFSTPVMLNSVLPDALFELPIGSGQPTSDTFGSAATVSQRTPGADSMEILLAGGPRLSINFSYTPSMPNPGDPSGIRVSAGMPPDAIENAINKEDVSRSEEPLDLEGNLLNPVVVLRAEFQDLGSPGVVDDGDLIRVTFSRGVVVASTNPFPFTFPVSGDSFGLTATVTQPVPASPELVEITLLGVPFLTPDGVFDPILTVANSPSGLDLAFGLPLGSVVDLQTGTVNASPGTLAIPADPVDVEGGLLVPPAPRLLSVDFDDANSNRQADDGDRLILQFDVAVSLASPAVTGLSLPVSGDFLGASAALGQGVPGSSQVELTLAGGPILTVNGIFTTGQTAPGNPSSLELLGGSEIRDTGAGITADPAGPFDIVGVLEPFVVSSLFLDRNNNGFGGLDDEVQVTFDRNIRVFGGLQPASVLQLPHTGDDFGSTARFVGATFDTPTITVRLGMGAVLNPGGLFLPLNPGAGPSGIDLLPGTGLVQDMVGGVGAEPLSPAGVDIGGVVGPKIQRAHYQDLNANQVVDQGDQVVVFFWSFVDINDADPANIFELQVPTDSFGTNAQFLGGVGPQGVLTAAVVLGASPVLNPNGYFTPSAVIPGDPSGLDFLPAASVVLSGTGLPALRRAPVAVDLRGSLPGLEGPGPWRPTGNNLTTARFAHAVTTLQDGKILVVGGGDSTVGSLDSIEVFDPSGGVPGQGEFTVAPVTLMTAREAHTATRIAGPDRLLDTPDDVVVVIGGIQFAGAVVGLGSIEIIDPDANDDGVIGDWQVIQFPTSRDFSKYTITPPNPDPPEPASIYGHVAVYTPGANVMIPGVLGAQDNLSRQIFTVGGMAYLQAPTSPGPSLIDQYSFGLVTVDPNGDGNYSDSDVTLYEVPLGGQRMSRFTRDTPTATLLPGVDGVVGTGDDEVFVYGGYGLDRDDTSGTGGVPQQATLGSGEVIYGLGTGQTPDYASVVANEFYPGSPQQGGGTPGAFPTPRNGHQAVLLTDGTVLIAHGTNEDQAVGFLPGNDLSTAYTIFTPDYANRPASTIALDVAAVTPAPPAGVPESLIGPGMVTLPGIGRVLVAGGLDFLNSADPADPDPTDLGEEILAIPFPPTGVLTGNSMSSPRASPIFQGRVESRFPLTVAPGVDLLLGTADDRPVAIGGVVDNLFNPTDTADFFIP